MIICLDQRTGIGCGTTNPTAARQCWGCGRDLHFALHVQDPGIVLGGYRILDVIGHGSFGAVYQAIVIQRPTGSSLLPGQHVAIKETFDTANLQKVQAEFGLLRQLHHPNLPQYYDCFEEQGKGYLVMEYVPGQNLAELLVKRGGPLEESVALGFAIQLCRVLAYLHHRQPPILHRDIKPANIRLTPDGQIKLVDFGLLKQWGTGTTRSSQFALTPEYAPLEQWSAGTTDTRSDIYSLGATLYHLLTGQHPIPALERLNVSPDPLRPPVSSNPRLSQHVSDAIMIALRLQKQDRFADVAMFERSLTGQLALDLHEAPTQHGPSVALLQPSLQVQSPTVPDSPPQRQAQQHGVPVYRRWQIWVMALLVVMLITGGGAWYAMRSTGNTAVAGTLARSETVSPVPSTAVVANLAQSTPAVQAATTNVPTPALTPTPLPTATPRGPSATEMQVKIGEPPSVNIGEPAELDITVRNMSTQPAHVISVRISENYFAAYTVAGAEPALIADHVAADGKRYFDFPGIPGETGGVYRLKLVRTAPAFPGDARLEIFTHNTGIFAQPLANTLLPTPTPTATRVPTATPTRIPPTSTPRPISLQKVDWTSVLYNDPRLNTRPAPEKLMADIGYKIYIRYDGNGNDITIGYPDLKHIDYGDISGDGVDDAVITLASGGSSGTSGYLVYEATSSGPKLIAAKSIFYVSVRIQNEQLIVENQMHTPTDALCCPSYLQITTYRIQGDNLVMITTKVIPAK